MSVGIESVIKEQLLQSNAKTASRVLKYLDLLGPIFCTVKVLLHFIVQSLLYVQQGEGIIKEER